jgi:hypothetical protein
MTCTHGSQAPARTRERRRPHRIVACVARLTPEQVRKRDRVETVIGIAAPVLDLVLAAGERLSRLVERDDPEYYPPESPGREPSPPADGV